MRFKATVAALALVGMMATPAQALHRDDRPHPVGDLETALYNFVASPDKVAGANDWTCRPSRHHPHPVVLIPGTGANLGSNFAPLSPMLANAGYCVFALNVGMVSLSFGRFGGLGSLIESGKSVAAFVDKVRTATGARKVDLVGHSEGGLLATYFIKRLGGASKVRTSIGWVPSHHGTLYSGLVTLGEDLKAMGLVEDTFDLLQFQGLSDQIADSVFQRALFPKGEKKEVPAGPHYVVISTVHDHVITPYTNAFLKGPGVRNFTIQEQCPDDPVGHIGMFIDSPVLQNTMNVLGPNAPAFKAKCENYGIPVI